MPERSGVAEISAITEAELAGRYLQFKQLRKMVRQAEICCEHGHSVERHTSTPVPELTRSTDVQVNERVLLHYHLAAVSLRNERRLSPTA
jgi:hypothetical protein